MKAIILAGGEGTRLHPLTYKIPKALIPVQGKTLTEHVLDIYKKVGVTDIIMSISYLAEQMTEYFGDGSKFGVTVEYLKEEERRGTAGPLLMLREANRQLVEDFYMCNGDNLFSLDLNQMLERHQQSGAVATIALTEVEDPTSRGVVRMEGAKIVEFVEKPTREEAPSNYVSSGYYILAPEVFNFLPDQKFVMLETDVWPVLAKAGKLFGFKSSAQWFDTGTPERYLDVEQNWKGVNHD
ncbi:MAG: NDP-sugar synthase [Patescibacteria group bacterium]|nr:NDP-sugar synthase [Patescibacteria group bacterium]